MALTKVQNTGIADDAVTTDKIENTTVVAADIAAGTVSADKLASTLDLSSKTVTLKNLKNLAVYPQNKRFLIEKIMEQ